MIKHENTTTVIISLQWLLSSCLLFNFGDVCIFKTTISKTNLPHVFTVVTTQSLINCYHTFCLCIIKQEVRAVLKLTWFNKGSNQNAGKKKKKQEEVQMHVLLWLTNGCLSLLGCYTSVPTLFSHIPGLPVLCQSCDSWIYNAMLDIGLARGILSLPL